MCIYICGITHNNNNLKRKEMIEETTNEILNAVKELIAHDHTMESLKVLIKHKLRHVYNAGTVYNEFQKSIDKLNDDL